MKQTKAEKRRSSSWWPLIAVCGLWVLSLFALKSSGIVLPPIQEASPTSRLANGELPVLWKVPTLSSMNQNGQPVTNADLRDHVLIIDFIYTRCTSACPLVTAQMVMLQKVIQQPEVRFLSLSIDPTYDTPDKLKEYAANWKGDEARWQLLHLPQTPLQQFAADMKVAVLPANDSTSEILHSDLFFLVDQQSSVRGVYRGSDAASMRQLVTDTVSLVGGKTSAIDEMAAPLSDSENGKRLFNSLGCTACHNQVRIAPPLGGILGTSVKLADGTNNVADEAYVRESILDPKAKIVAGYLEIMPSYRDYLSDKQITQLVTYLRTLPKPPADQDSNSLQTAGQRAPQTTTIDPVCKMRITVGDDTPQAEYQNKTYHFCSDNCRLRFTHEPGKYANQKRQSE